MPSPPGLPRILIEGVAEALELANRLGIETGGLAEAIEGGPLQGLVTRFCGSPVALPGAVHDLTAARIAGLPGGRPGNVG